MKKKQNVKDDSAAAKFGISNFNKDKSGFNHCFSRLIVFIAGTGWLIGASWSSHNFFCCNED